LQMVNQLISSHFHPLSREGVRTGFGCSNAVLQPVLSGVELSLSLHRFLVFLQEHLHLLLPQGLPVEPFVHLHDFFPLVFQLLLLSLLSGGHARPSINLALRHLLHVVEGLAKLQVDVCFDHADLGVGFALQDVDRVVSPSMIDVNCVTFEDARVVRQLSLQSALGVRQVDESGLVRLDFHIVTLLERDISQDDLGSLLEKEVVHEPHWQVAHSFFSRKL